ncbi:terminase gpA endonuclease subunit, partial [Martelella sp. HB161492]|uniref:terminase gpA endonuclease subunit n=1 Tax=Martelella sp. HB161492 TaxID=2720726 RepID=UPI0015907DDA
LGLAFEADNKAVDWEDLRDRADATGFKRGIVPADSLALTMGIDVQGDRVEWLLRGWGRNKASAVIDYGVIDSRAGSHLAGYREHSGHISEPQVMKALDQLIAKRWPDENGKPRSIDRVGIDGNAYTEDVWFWVRGHPRSKVIMVRGDNRDTAPLLSQVREYDKSGRPKKQKWSTRFFNFNASVMKIGLYRDFKKNDPEAPGYIRFATGLGDAFYQQATSEVRVKEKDRSGYPRWRWKLPEGQRNEVLDMMNQSRAAAIRLGVPYWSDEAWDVRAEELAKLEPERQGDLEDLIGNLAAVAEAVSRAQEERTEAAEPTQTTVPDRVAAAMRRAGRAAQRNGRTP